MASSDVVNGHRRGADDDVDAAAAADGHADDARLSHFFDAAHEALLKIEASEAPTNDGGLQRRIANAVRDLEWATVAASRLDLFSANEDVEELPTSSLKFLLLPAYLGRLTNKKAIDDSGDATASRKRFVDTTVAYLEDFLTRLGHYGVFNESIPTKAEGGGGEKNGGGAGRGRGRGGPPDLRAMNAEREAKIRRFKEGKEREERLEAFEARRKEEKLGEDEERKYWLEVIDDWAHKALDDLESLRDERDILEFMAQRSSGNAVEAVEPPTPKKVGNPFAGRPFILARDAMQKQVFGMGYPSLPTMTVEEWYDEQAAAGLLPTPDQSRVQMDQAMRANDPEVRQAEEEQRAADEDEKGERDDEDARRKKIEWDDWKDDHRRGWGNRKNMG